MALQYAVLSTRMSQVSAILASLQNRDDNIYRTIFEAEPIADNIRKAGYGGTDRYKKIWKDTKNSALMENTTKKLDAISRQLYVQSKSFDEIISLAKNKEKMMTCIPAIQPVKKTQCTIVSGLDIGFIPFIRL